MFRVESLAPSALPLLSLLVVVTPACAPDPERERLRESVQAVYEEETWRLREITYDSDQNGAIDTWTYMDGTRVLRVEIDYGEDETVDRWEYYDEMQQLEKVGFSHGNDGVVDAWGTRARMHRSRKLKFPPCVTGRLIAGSTTRTASWCEQKRMRAVTVGWISGRPMPTERSSRPRSTRTVMDVRIDG